MWPPRHAEIRTKFLLLGPWKHGKSLRSLLQLVGGRGPVYGRGNITNRNNIVLGIAALCVAACGANGNGPSGSGGTADSGGTLGTAGVPSSGGVIGSGGNTGTGTAGTAGTAAIGTAGSSGSSGGTLATGAAGRGAGGTGSGGTGTGAAGMGSTGTGGTGMGGVGTGAAGTGGLAGGQSGGGGGSAPAFDGASVMSIMRRVADYEIAQFGTGNDNGWVRAVFHTGMLAAYRALGDAKYHDYTLHWGQVNNWQLHADSDGPRFADNQACVQSYAELYLETPTTQNNVMIAAAQTTFDAMVASPKTGRVEWWWCDALYMAPAAMARVAQATGNTKYVTLMNAMFWDTKAFLYDPAQSLFWRDSTFVNTNTYWARGNGWVIGGIARILEVLPATDSRRADYVTLLSQMAAKLRTVQASDGFWRSSLTQPNAFTTPETSGTTFFCYAIAWGINHGVLDRATYLPTVMKAWAALGTAVNAQGRLGWVQAVGKAPGPSTVDATNDYAAGAFLLAGSEVLKL